MLGKRLRALRRERGMTQQELGDALGVSASAVGMYEQGRRAPDNRTLAALCRFFGVSSDYLLLEDAPAPQAAELEEMLEDFRRKLLGQEGLMFNGVPLSGSDVAQIVSAIEVGTMVAVDKLAKRREETDQ